MPATSNEAPIAVGDMFVALTEVRACDLVCFEQLGHGRVGVRALASPELLGHPGPVFRIERSPKHGRIVLVEVDIEELHRLSN